MSFSKEQRLINQMSGSTKQERNNRNEQPKETFVLPNNSGDHMRSIKRDAPVNDFDIVNKAYVDLILTTIYPVGALYISTLSTNPATLLGFGTWTAYAQGLYLVGVPAGGTGEGSPASQTALTDKENRAVGQHTHTFTGNAVTSGGQSANHTHAQDSRTWIFETGGSPSQVTPGGGIYMNRFASSTTGSASGDHTHTTTATGTNANAGSVAGTNAPYIQVYMWKRTA